jgi:RNA polymerase sigma factor (sigma-70 family)
VVAVVDSDNPAELGPAERDRSDAVALDAATFCRSLYPRLVGALSLCCRNRDDATELAQETLSRVIEHWGGLRAHDDPEAWAFRTGFNLANSRWRRRAVARRFEELRRRRPEDESSTADGTDEAIDVRRAVAALPPRQREVVAFRYFLDCSVAETALRMGCAEGTVKALTHQAIDALRVAGLADLEGAHDE